MSAGLDNLRIMFPMIEAFGKSVIRAAGSSIGRQIIRGVMGSIFGGGGRRR